MCNKNIEEPVAIHISERNAHVRHGGAKLGVRDATLCGFFIEGPIPLIDIKTIGHAVVRDENVRPMISIEVSTKNPQACARSLCQAGDNSHVLEAHHPIRIQATIVKKPGSGP